MGDRAIGLIEVGEHGAASWLAVGLQRAYIPVATAFLVMLFAALLVYQAEPLTAPPPEQRKEIGANPELTPPEEKLAAAVIEPGFAARAGREQVLFIGNSQTMAIPYAQPWDIQRRNGSRCCYLAGRLEPLTSIAGRWAG